MSIRRGGIGRRGGRISSVTPSSAVTLPTDNLLAHFGHTGGSLNVTTSSGKIDQWTDTSSNLYHITETGTNRPTVASSAINSLDAVDFNRGSLERLNRATTPSNAQPTTHYCVFSCDAHSVSDWFIDGSGATYSQAMTINSSGVLGYYSGGTVRNGSTLSTATWYAACWVFDSTDYQYIDDFTTADVSLDSGSNAMDGISLGSRYDNSVSSHWDGQIACYAVYSVAHDQTQRNSVRDYLNSTYGLSIT